MEKVNASRIWLISDSHLGVRSNSKEWMDIIDDYFDNFFIPLILKEKKEGDVLVHCGDVFDSRQSINLYVLNKGIRIFEKISEIMPVYMIIGNHDIFMKHTNDINSLKVFRNVNNITIFEKPTHLMFGNKKMFFLPWVEDVKELKQILQNPKNFSDVLFCHTDIVGLSFNRFTKVDEGAEVKELENYSKVYSGHIHYAQKLNNVRMLGCPYELTRSDSDNQKSVWVYDLESGQEIQYKNDYTPKFLKYRLEWILEQNIDDLQKIFFNNFIDITVCTQWIFKFPFSSFVEKFTGYRRINPSIISEDAADADDLEEEATEEISIVDLIQVYINELNYSQAIKEKLYSVSKKMYQETLKDLEEKRNIEKQDS